MAKTKRYKDPAWEKKYHRKQRVPPPPKVVPQGTGPILYCPACGRQTATYGSPSGKGLPKPDQQNCPACRQRARAVYSPKSGKRSSGKVSRGSSVRTVSGGLPTLGKRHR